MMSFSKSLAVAAAVTYLLANCAAAESELLPPGYRPLPLGVHALVGGKVVIKPGSTLEHGTIVIRDGFIQAVGADIPVPADARVWDMKGMTIYAGFIEPYLVLNASNPPINTSATEPISSHTFASDGVKFYGAPGDQTDMGTRGPGYEVAKITPQIRAVEAYSPQEKALAPLRELGFTVGVIAPAKGIIRGTSALVALADEDPDKAVIKPDVFQHIAFEIHEDDESVYPGSLMGVIAAIRQSFFDAQHYELERASYDQNPVGHHRPEYNPALRALMPAAGKKMRVAFEPGSALMVDRSAQVARELNLDFCIVSCGQEWRRPDLAKQTGATFIVPVDFPSLPKLPSDEDWEQVKLDQLRAWDWAPENPALLRKQGLEIALTTYGLADRKTFRQNLRLALDRGLSEDDALAALTTVPAKLCGVNNQLGTVETNKLADLVVVAGTNYFDPEAKVQAVWIDGRIYTSAPEEPKPGAATEMKSTSAESSANDGTPAKEEPEKHPQPPSIAQQQPTATQSNTNSPPEEKTASTKDGKKEQLRSLRKTRLAHSPMEGRGAIAHPPAVLIRNATIWTSGPQGILTNSELLISGGKVLSEGALSSEPTNALVIDAAGEFVTPGIIDCHSHTAILGNVNESALPSTAMVRIRDVVNSETENIYEQLAGGVTMVNLLHGSANPIGGQNCVIKMRDGDSPEELIFSNAPQGIKFALGENVKQSNWGEKFVTRFPQTRMGVRTFYGNRFTAAQEYLQAWDDYRKKSSAGQAGLVPPRRDLELEAIGEIIQGKRLIHCHAYRQDEMLMLMRTLEPFGVKVTAFHHVLEGYKIADELAAGGVGGTTFSDWWAFKFESYDAIPYNGSLMRERGVTVSYNSDSSELARRLYLEAAKAVKYGGTPEEEALKFVTLNPAKQLHIDQWVGSLEPGKDGDFAIWSKSPLDSGTVCLQTWIGGKKYFDRSLNAARVERLQKERNDLIAKAKQIAKLSEGGNEIKNDNGKSFFRVSLEHQYDGQERHCLDDLTEGGE